MQKSLYFVMLLTAACCAQITHYVTPTPDTLCPGEPCHTLSEYAAEQYLYPTMNRILVFLPGDHTLEQTMSVKNVNGLTLHGSSSSLPKITSRIVCIWPAGFNFRDITELYISALAFNSCGHKNSTALSITSVNQVTISYSIFQNNTSISGRGGALYVEESTLNATENTFQDNSAAEGGALYIDSTIFNRSEYTLVGNTFQNNHMLTGEDHCMEM